MGQWWHIWAEGYRATGEHGTATYHGKVWADTFEDACRHRFKGDRNFDPENPGRVWACRLFDNESDARESYG